MTQTLKCGGVTQTGLSVSTRNPFQITNLLSVFQFLGTQHYPALFVFETLIFSCGFRKELRDKGVEYNIEDWIEGTKSSTNSTSTASGKPTPSLGKTIYQLSSLFKLH